MLEACWRRAAHRDGDGAGATHQQQEQRGREDDPEESTWDYWRESMGSYAEGVKQSADPVARWVRDAGSGVRDKASGAWDWIRRRPSESEDEGGEEKPSDVDAPETPGPGDPDSEGPEFGPDGVIDV